MLLTFEYWGGNNWLRVEDGHVGFNHHTSMMTIVGLYLAFFALFVQFIRRLSHYLALIVLWFSY